MLKRGDRVRELGGFFEGEILNLITDSSAGSNVYHVRSLLNPYVYRLLSEHDLEIKNDDDVIKVAVEQAKE